MDYWDRQVFNNAIIGVKLEDTYDTEYTVNLADFQKNGITLSSEDGHKLTDPLTAAQNDPRTPKTPHPNPVFSISGMDVDLNKSKLKITKTDDPTKTVSSVPVNTPVKVSATLRNTDATNNAINVSTTTTLKVNGKTVSTPDTITVSVPGVNNPVTLNKKADGTGYEATVTPDTASEGSEAKVTTENFTVLKAPFKVTDKIIEVPDENQTTPDGYVRIKFDAGEGDFAGVKQQDDGCKKDMDESFPSMSFFSVFFCLFPSFLRCHRIFESCIAM